MLHATIVTTQEDLDQIYRLNQQNLKENVSKQEKQEQGFVTWLYSPELLQSMHNLAPSIIVKHNNTVVAYALVTLKEAAPFHKDLENLFRSLKQLQYKNQDLFSYSFYCIEQVCVHKDFRGKGVFNMLFNKHKELYSKDYDLLVTEISTSNPRSQRAHEKVGFKTIYTHTDELDEWNVVVWDWR